MKTTVRYDDIREFDLRPGASLSDYLHLTENDVRDHFLQEMLTHCNCPGCLSRERIEGFQKFGLQYWECKQCHTLYISPRPTEQAIEDYYLKSKAHKFWNEQFLTETESKRREKLFKPRLQWIIETIEEYSPSTQRFSIINSIHPHFVDELIKSNYFKEITVINPRPDLGYMDYAKPGVQLIEKPIDSISKSLDAIALFESLDRLSDVEAFFEALKDTLMPSGLCFLTTISASGFDLQILWEKSNSVFPPDRINAFSIEGLMILFERHGFECIELSTPGLLDVQIVANAFKGDPSVPLPRFVEYLLDKRDSEAHQSFQEFLQMNRLSSFTRAVFQKK